jgi:threonine/homoserine/homoserine lactone efflux protein
MIDGQQLYLFFIASLALNLTPGNDILYVSSRSLSQGVRAGLVSALGVFAGCSVHVLGAVVGLSIVIAQSAILFEAIKYAGAAFLICMGALALIRKSAPERGPDAAAPAGAWKLFLQGALTNALNPKVAIFFVSFLPQFVDGSSPGARLQFLMLGVWFAVQGTLVLVAVALLFGRASKALKAKGGVRGIMEKVTGVILVGLGIRLALASRK